MYVIKKQLNKADIFAGGYFPPSYTILPNCFLFFQENKKTASTRFKTRVQKKQDVVYIQK